MFLFNQWLWYKDSMADQPDKQGETMCDADGDAGCPPPSSQCAHEPVEIFRPGSSSPWSDDSHALMALNRGEGSLKVHVCRLCGVLYSTVTNWPTPLDEIEAENIRLRAELDAIKSAQGEGAGGDVEA